MGADTGTGSRLVLWIVGIIVVAAIAAAAVLSTIGSPASLDPATPEGVAQRFFDFVLDGDDEGALALATTGLQESCSENGRLGFFIDTESSVRVVLRSVEIDDDRAVVDVEVNEINEPSPFDFDGHTFDTRLVMVRRGAGWAISEFGWPFYCAEGS